MSDSGVASGNHALEAVSHAVCELVERDAMTMWHYAKERDRLKTRIGLKSIEDDGCRALLERFERAGVRVAVWEVTTDVGIPAFVCTIADASPSPWRPLMPATGSGCHPCREVALARALTEAAQVRLTVIAGTRDDIGLDLYRRGTDRDGLKATLNRMAASPERAFSDGPGQVSDTVDADVAWELACLQRAGIEEVVMVDLTLPEYALPVVRVVIPGLEGMHDAAGFVPGRRLREGYT
jgi:ribosomal protein S12 methylthiotransferase accessory factor